MKRKKKLHDKIGKNIEELYSENIRKYCGVLADHFIEGEHFIDYLNKVNGIRMFASTSTLLEIERRAGHKCAG